MLIILLTISIKFSSSFAQFSLPLDTLVITSGYGMRIHPVFRKDTFHNGVDLRCRFATVYAIAQGRVAKTGENSRSGKFIEISHNGFSVSYAHLSTILRQRNEQINAGDVIAISGDSGTLTGAHLHLTVRIKAQTIDPLKFLLKLYLITKEL
ncbi:M23 family metallopeptidase [Pedobacter sp. AW1-32]|uniref:M23 family metallopeptidase n=1 Tax=Pedobacter sp. AW1-32 TaxID=3383026 RepID=UPI003FF14D16